VNSEFAAINKKILFEGALKELNARLEVLVNSAFEAKEASTNPESKAENKYDTRGLEASYLAAGQAQRAQELKKHIYQMNQVQLADLKGQKIRLSALVHLKLDDEEDKYFFILPVGGLNLSVGDISVLTLAPEAPLGKLLLGKSEGDDFEFKDKEYRISDVR
jgi:transcription elongation GreA/GreB family factor